MGTYKVTPNTVLLLLILMLSCSEPQIGASEITPDPIESESVIVGSVKVSGKGIPDVIVTDGYNFAKTGEMGEFSIEAHKKATHVYISSPSGYTVPVVKSVPQFYKPITSSMKKEEVHFELIKMDRSDEKHCFIAIGDPQVRNAAEVAKLKPILEFLKKDIVVNGLDPVHLMVTGDIVFDKPGMHEESKNTFSVVDQPVYYAIGNHDHLKNTGNPASVQYDRESEQDYRAHYGPTYYSFNRGKVHYIIFDNILYEGGPATKYSTEITQEQLNWIQKDLEYVSKDKVIVLMSHSPTKSRYKAFYGNSASLFALLAGYKEVHVITGHTHNNSVLADDTHITDHTIGACCGGWWEGPVCPDGAYIGYKIFEIDGTKVKWKYRAYEYPEDQFSIYTPQEWTASELISNRLLVNVWDWDKNWTVMWSEDGKAYKELPRTAERIYDPVAFEYFGAEGNSAYPPSRTWINASPTDHIFVATPMSSTKKISIKAINPFGEEFTKEVNLQ